MPVLTSEQKKASDNQRRELYGKNLERLKELAEDNSVSTWWGSVEGTLSRGFMKQDNNRVKALKDYVQKKIPFDRKY